MKRKKSTLLICIICAIGIAVMAAAALIMNRLHQQKEAAVQEEVRQAQEVAEQYLRETYDEEMICYDARKTRSLFHDGKYWCKFYPKDAPELKFEVFVYDDFSGADDDYLKVRAEAVLQPVYQAYASEIWGDGVQITVKGHAGWSRYYIVSDSAEELVAHELFDLDIAMSSDLTEENLHETAVQIDTFRELLGNKNLMPYSFDVTFPNRRYVLTIYLDCDTLEEIEEALNRVRTGSIF